MSAGPSVRVRTAATPSSASGRQSTRRQIWAMAARLPSVSVNWWSIARARLTKSWTAASSGSGQSSYSRSPAIRRDTRLVTRTFTSGQVAAIVASSPVAGRRCSNCPAREGRAALTAARQGATASVTPAASPPPSACTSAWATMLGSSIPASGTQATPSGNTASRRSAASAREACLPNAARPGNGDEPDGGSPSTSAHLPQLFLPAYELVIPSGHGG